METPTTRDHYAVETFRDRRWRVHRFARLAAAQRFAAREAARLRLGLEVVKVYRDGLGFWRTERIGGRS